MSIVGFGDTRLEAFFCTGVVPRAVGWAFLHKIVLRKLDLIQYAHSITDLRVPPGNRLERLQGDLVGFHSIRVNRQWWIIFRWTEEGADAVQVVDYH